MNFAAIVILHVVLIWFTSLFVINSDENTNVQTQPTIEDKAIEYQSIEDINKEEAWKECLINE